MGTHKHYGQLEGQPVSASVGVAEATTSTAYTNLATAGPAVTVTIPPSGKVRVEVAAMLWSSTVGTTYASFALTGANTVPASDDRSLLFSSASAGLALRSTASTILTGLTPGSTTFTMKYRSGGGGAAANYTYRTITVTPL